MGVHLGNHDARRAAQKPHDHEAQDRDLTLAYLMWKQIVSLSVPPGPFDWMSVKSLGRLTISEDDRSYDDKLRKDRKCLCVFIMITFRYFPSARLKLFL